MEQIAIIEEETWKSLFVRQQIVSNIRRSQQEGRREVCVSNTRLFQRHILMQSHRQIVRGRKNCRRKCLLLRHGVSERFPWTRNEFVIGGSFRERVGGCGVCVGAAIWKTLCTASRQI